MFRGHPARDARRQAAFALLRLRHIDIARRILELRAVLQKEQIHAPDGAVALLGDDQFRQAAQLSSFGLYTSSRKMKATRSASCSMDPDSRRSLNCGR